MQHKTSFLAGVLLLALLLVFPQNARCAEQTPEAFIKAFYTWYIGVSNGEQDPIKDNEILTYVEKESVERLQRKQVWYGSDRRDYFLKMSQWPVAVEKTTLKVAVSSELGNATSIMLVTITEIQDERTVTHDPIVVIVRKNDGKFKIVKCVDTYPEA